MLFKGGGGDVINNGAINAEQSAYLIGENVVNNGAIHCPGGLVVTAAGDKLRLGRRASNVIVNVGTDLIAGKNDSITNNGTVGEDRRPVAKLVLAAGDVFSQAINNVADVAVIATDEVELGDFTAAGIVKAYSDQQANTGSSLAANGNVTLGNNTQSAAGKMLQTGVTVDPEPYVEPDTGSSNPGQQSDSQLTGLQQQWQINAKLTPRAKENFRESRAAMAGGAEGNTEYALAREYLDALAEYVGTLNSDMNLTAADSMEFVLNKYIEPLVENENIALATFLAAKLTNPSGS